jgi:hypothetical protein
MGVNRIFGIKHGRTDDKRIYFARRKGQSRNFLGMAFYEALLE